jgi:hypothetical protein
MNQQEFWTLINISIEGTSGDKNAQCQKLQEQLLLLAPEVIVQFQSLFDGYMIQEGCSDDGFIDFRSWLISKGQTVYEASLKDPDSLADSITPHDGACQFELFQYVAVDAWSQKTGQLPDLFPYGGNVARKQPAGREWRYDTHFEKRFPKLCARFRANFLKLAQTRR